MDPKALTHQLALPQYWIPNDLQNGVRNNRSCFSNIEKADEYQKVLDKLKNVDRLNLSECHYLQFLKLGLYLEEFEKREELKMFNIDGKKIERISYSAKTFKINMNHIDKDSPLHKSCIRLIEVFNPADNTKFVLNIKNVTDTHIVARAFPE